MQRVALQINDPDVLDNVSMMLAGEPNRVVLDPKEPAVVIADHLPVDELVPIIVLEDSANPFEILKAGASGVLPRSSTISALLLAIDAVAYGFAILPRDVSHQERRESTQRSIPNKPSSERDHMLTARELDVLRLLAEGASDKLIARRLGISFHTAKFHVASIAAKLDATGRTDALAQAVRLGLILL